MKKIALVVTWIVCALGAIALDAASAEAQTAQTQTGYVRSVQVNGPSDYLVVTLSASVSGGAALGICYPMANPPFSGTQPTYSVYYATTASRDTIRADFRATLTAALLAGRQVTVTTVYSASECTITDVTILS